MSTIHTVTIILVNRTLPVQTFLHEILLPSWTSYHHHHFKQSVRLFHYINFYFYYASECSIIPRIIIIKIATYYSQNYAGILGSGLLYRYTNLTQERASIGLYT